MSIFVSRLSDTGPAREGNGDFTAEASRGHADRHKLMQAVGVGDTLRIDRLTVPIEGGDRILLCSDGLHDPLTNGEIQAVLSSGAAPSEQCGRLVERAKEEGGEDDITVIVAHVA